MLERQISLCSELRRISIAAVVETVNALREGSTSERQALNLLVGSLYNHGITDYWYPAGEDNGAKQFGCIVVFDTKSGRKRTAFSNARTLISSTRIKWEGLGYFYVSPQKLTELGEIVWGDFACSVYTGKSSNVKSFFSRSWHLSESLLNAVSKSANMSTCKLFMLYQSYARNFGIKNIAMSKVGPTVGASSINIGHSFPWVSDVQTADITGEFMNALRKKRIFIDNSSDISLRGRIWTLEPRDHAQHYPFGAISFHRLFAVKGSSLIKLPDQDELFRSIGMDWIFEG